MTVRPPLATPEQEALELAAVRLLQRADVQKMVREVADYWRAATTAPADHLARFEGEFEQAAFCGIINALNLDPNHPKVQIFARFEHETAGVRIPGTKASNPNPDYIYRLCPIDGAGHFVFHGTAPARRPIGFEFSVLDRDQVYLGNISAAELAVGSDGRFQITVDPEPANGRPNHIQTRPGAFQVLVRDILADVAVERPYGLRVERLGAVPPPRGEAEIVALVAPTLRKYVDDLMPLIGRLAQMPANQWAAPTIPTGAALSGRQAYSGGRFQIADDEALIFTLTLGGAGYAVVPVNNMWGGVNDFLHHVGCLGTGRARPNPDGSFTFVLSLSDPGIYNWVDPDGLHDGLSIIRWMAFGRDADAGDKPTLQVRLVKLAELPTVLPPGVPRVDAAGRHQQLTRHCADYLAAMG